MFNPFFPVGSATLPNSRPCILRFSTDEKQDTKDARRHVLSLISPIVSVDNDAQSIILTQNTSVTVRAITTRNLTGTNLALVLEPIDREITVAESFRKISQDSIIRISSSVRHYEQQTSLNF
jgi:hypothetical protein